MTIAKLNFAGKVMNEATRCQGAYSEVILAKYGRNVAGTLAALIRHRDYLDKHNGLRSDDWFFIEWSNFEKRTGISINTIKTALTKLKNEKLIDWKNGDSRKSPYFRLHIGAIVDAAKIDKPTWDEYFKSTKSAKLVKTSSGVWEVVEPKNKKSAQNKPSEFDSSRQNLTAGVNDRQLEPSEFDSRCQELTAGVSDRQTYDTIYNETKRNESFNETEENESVLSSKATAPKTGAVFASCQTSGESTQKVADNNVDESGIEEGTQFAQAVLKDFEKGKTSPDNDSVDDSGLNLTAEIDALIDSDKPPWQQQEVLPPMVSGEAQGATIPLQPMQRYG